MVVNGDEAVREAICFVLRLEGLDVCAHEDAVGALACPHANAALCFVLGDRPPTLDGCALLAGLRAINQRAPAILIAGRVTNDLHVRAREAGVTLVLEKPLLDNALVEAVLSAVQSQNLAT